MEKSTRVLHAGRAPQAQHGLVNTPVYRGSTVLFRTLAELDAAVQAPSQGVVYGRYGTPTQFALQDAITELEGAHGTVLAGSGLGAIACALLAFVKAGDELLVTDGVYEPTRRFCAGTLKRLGVTTRFFAPDDDVTGLLTERTAAVMLESPASLSFELLDIPAIAAAAQARGARVIVDNTWATPLLCNPLALGADVVVHAATKYIVGHADALLGTISCNEATHERVRSTAMALGAHASPDDCFLALRGLRTLAVRLQRHAATALELAQGLQARPEVRRVLHPALPDFPGHLLWQRDCRGASGLFGVVLQPVDRTALARMLDGMTLFGMGFSWGGYESLILPVRPERSRSARPWLDDGTVVRIHAGLDDARDLRADLEAGLARLRA